jgi:hypothetical protein
MTKQPDEKQNVLVVEHLLIRDAATKAVLLNQRQNNKDKKRS